MDDVEADDSGSSEDGCDGRGEEVEEEEEEVAEEAERESMEQEEEEPAAKPFFEQTQSGFFAAFKRANSRDLNDSHKSSEWKKPEQPPNTHSSSNSASARPSQKQSESSDSPPQHKSGNVPINVLNSAFSRSEDSLGGLAEMYSKQGKDCYVSGHYDKSLEFFNKAIHISPKTWVGRANAFGNRAASFLMLHRYVRNFLNLVSKR
jgi:hypothetical protein